MAGRLIAATERHAEFRNDLIAVAKEYSDLPAIELLCVVSQLVGQLIAHQNQFEYTPERVMRHVEANISLGNKLAMEEINKDAVGRA